jgi:hypothetical protein
LKSWENRASKLADYGHRNGHDCPTPKSVWQYAFSEAHPGLNGTMLPAVGAEMDRLRSQPVLVADGFQFAGKSSVRLEALAVGRLQCKTAAYPDYMQ